MTAVDTWDARKTWNEPHECATLDELAEKLSDHNWTLCTAWALPGGRYVLAQVGGGEWRVYRDVGTDTYDVIESITFGWCDRARCLHYLEKIAAGDYDADIFGHTAKSRFARHGYSTDRGPCGQCA